MKKDNGPRVFRPKQASNWEAVVIAPNHLGVEHLGTGDVDEYVNADIHAFATLADIEASKPSIILNDTRLYESAFTRDGVEAGSQFPVEILYGTASGHVYSWQVEDAGGGEYLFTHAQDVLNADDFNIVDDYAAGLELSRKKLGGR